MEGEPKTGSSGLEAELRAKGYRIERLGAEEWSQCSYSREDCFDDAEWFVEGSFYCSRHKDAVVEIIREEDARREREGKRNSIRHP